MAWLVETLMRGAVGMVWVVGSGGMAAAIGTAVAWIGLV